MGCRLARTETWDGAGVKEPWGACRGFEWCLGGFVGVILLVGAKEVCWYILINLYLLHYHQAVDVQTKLVSR